MTNIGAANCFSGDELDAIIHETGDIEGLIPVSKIEQLMWYLVEKWSLLVEIGLRIFYSCTKDIRAIEHVNDNVDA